MIGNSKNPSNCCKFCGWEFHQDIIQRIIENKQPVLCEFCGIEINISSVNISERYSKEKFIRITNSDNDIKKKKNTIVKNIKKWILPKKYSISVISGDDDFPKIFKNNLIIVISRLIYIFIREWEQENNVNVRNVSLEKSILIYIIKKIRPILDKRVHSNFLNDLFKINREDFEDWLRILQKKLELDKEYQTHFKIYLTWLIKIVFKLVSDMWEMKNLPKFQAIILQDLKEFNPNLNDYPSQTSSEIVKKPKKQNLYNNKAEKLKECGKCHQILSYDNFFPVSRSSPEIRPYCKKCNSELTLIRQNRKKIKLILYDFNGKCSNCESDISLLPTLQFHHPNPQKKTLSWRDICGKNYNQIRNILKKENAIVLCSNCHLAEQATILYEYNALIHQEILFQLTPEEINNKIIKITKNISRKLDRMHIREKIREWIKKRFVIEYLYEGKCIGCGNTSLSALEFHHLDPNIDKKLKWDALECLDINTIIKQLVDQNCICVCSNCHSLIHSRYIEFVEEILDNFYNKDVILQKATLIKKHYENVSNNISNFKINQKKLSFKPPLTLEIPHTDYWKIHLLKIYYFIQKLNTDTFKAYNLRNILEISIRHIYKHLNRFIKKRYIEKDSTIRGRYKFTIYGLYIVKEIEKKHKLISLKIKKQILNL